MSENRPQRRGVESLPIALQPVRSQPAQRQSSYDEQLEDDRLYETRLPSSARRYRTTDHAQPTAVVRRGEQQLRRPNQYDNVNVYVRRKSAPAARPPAIQPPRPIRQPEKDETETEPLHRTRLHWLVYVGIGMMLVVLIWLLIVAVLNWWHGYQDDLHYGRPRTFQTDAIVGHNDATTPSHFIALNLNRHVEVIEFPGGDATHARVYLGPTLIGENSDLDVVTVSFKDVNGDGTPDMILVIENAAGTTKYVYLNDNGAFRPLKPGEHVSA